MKSLPKKIILSIILTFSFIFSSLAQDEAVLTKEQETSADQLVKKYNKDLNLSADQTIAFGNVIKVYMVNGQKIRDTEMTYADKAEALQANYQQESNTMENILNDKQYDTYKELKKDYQLVDEIKGYDVNVHEDKKY